MRNINRLFFVFLLVALAFSLTACSASDGDMRKLVKSKVGGEVRDHKVISGWDYYFVCREGTTIMARVDDGWPAKITDDVILDPNDFPCNKKQ